jgi:ribosomal protein L37AE/L43A
MENKYLVVIGVVVILVVIGIGLFWSMQTPKSDNSINNATKNATSSGEVQTQTQTKQSTSSKYETVTCPVCGKKWQLPRDSGALIICDQCIDTPEAQQLLTEAGYDV